MTLTPKELEIKERTEFEAWCKRNSIRTERHISGDKWAGWLARAKCEADTISTLREENRRLKDALTPSAQTKAAYMGEFQFQCGELTPNVPWTTIKEIMSAIFTYAGFGRVEPCFNQAEQTATQLASTPDSEGWWTWFPPDGDDPVTLEVYPLEPVGGTLCVWGPDYGLSYTGAAETQSVWVTDEWQGHVPVTSMGGTWQKAADPASTNQEGVSPGAKQL